MPPLDSYMIVLPPTVAIFSSENSLTGIGGFRSLYDKFGSVYLINDSCYKISVGDRVGFNITDAMLVTIGGDDFYLVDELNVRFREVIIP